MNEPAESQQQESNYYAMADHDGNEPITKEPWIQAPQVPEKETAAVIETCIIRNSSFNGKPEVILVLRDFGWKRLSATDVANLQKVYSTTDLRWLAGKSVMIRRETANFDGVRRDFVRITDAQPLGWWKVPRYRLPAVGGTGETTP